MNIVFKPTEQRTYVTNVRVLLFVFLKVTIASLFILAVVLLSEVNGWNNVLPSMLKVLYFLWIVVVVGSLWRGLLMKKWHYKITDTSIEHTKYYITKSKTRIISFNRIVAITGQEDWFNRYSKTRGVSFHTAGSKAPNIDITDIGIEEAETYTGAI